MENLAVIKISGYDLYVSLAVGILSVYPVALLFTQIIGKTLNVPMCCKYAGSLGIYSAFVSALYFSYMRYKTFKEVIITFAVCCLVIGLIIGCLELYCRNRKMDYDGNKKISLVVSGMATVGATIGVLFAKHISMDIVIGLLTFSFAFLYSAFIKYRQMKDSLDNELKIYLSFYWRRSFFALIAFFAVIVIGTVIFCLWSRNREDYVFVLCSLCFIIVGLVAVFCSKRFLTYALCNNQQICSFSFFNKKLCTVETEKPVYYAVFKTPKAYRSVEQFIALSNEPFLYQDTYGKAKVRFIKHYDMQKVVLLPYNSEVGQYLTLDKWNDIRK